MLVNIGKKYEKVICDALQELSEFEHMDAEKVLIVVKCEDGQMSTYMSKCSYYDMCEMIGHLQAEANVRLMSHMLEDEGDEQEELADAEAPE